MKNKKIFMILTNGFDPDIRVLKEAEYLVSQGNEVEILCWDRDCIYKEIELVNGIRIRRFLIKSIPGTGFKQLFPFIKFLKELRSYTRRNPYDYLHCHDFDGVLIGRFIRIGKAGKLIFDMHEIYTHYAYAKLPFFNRLFNSIIKRCDWIIYVNDTQIQGHLNLQKYVYLPNYPSKDNFKCIEKTTSESLRINYVGAVRDYDAMMSLIAIGQVNDKYEINIYGNGDCLEKIQKNTYHCNIIIHGIYDGIKDSEKIYRNTDILFAVYDPSVYNYKNGFPVKGFEAIITETPIIATRNTKFGDFVEKENIGATIEFCNLESLKIAIDEIQKNYTTYVKNIHFINDRYAWEDVVCNLDAIYKK